MTGLIIDTSGPWLNLAVCRKENILAQTSQLAGNRQAEVLPSELKGILSSARLSLAELEWLAVTVGPGSFTGLRVGISFAQGLAMGRGLRLLPLNTLDAMACLPEGHDGCVSPMLDAKKGQVYTALYGPGNSNFRPASPYRVIEPQLWVSALPPRTKIFGSGVMVYREMISSSCPGLTMDDAFPNGPEIKGLVKLAAQRLQEENYLPAAELDAFYIRPSDAVVKGHA